MAELTYTHDNEIITVKNCVTSSNANPILKLRLPKGSWQKKLEQINKKINKKWTINTQWILSINNQSISPNNVQQCEQVLSMIAPPITLDLITVQLCRQPRSK